MLLSFSLRVCYFIPFILCPPPPLLQSRCWSLVSAWRIHCSWWPFPPSPPHPSLPFFLSPFFPFLSFLDTEMGWEPGGERALEEDWQTLAALLHCWQSFSPTGGGTGGLEPAPMPMVRCVLHQVCAPPVSYIGIYWLPSKQSLLLNFCNIVNFDSFFPCYITLFFAEVYIFK